MRSECSRERRGGGLRRVTAALAAALGALLAGSPGPSFARHTAPLPGGGAAARPNILFILADDLGWGDLGCYGNRLIRTPNLDRLASQGSLFTQFYVGGSVCSPSRTAFMTGQFPARHRMHGHLAPPAQNAARGMPNWLDPAVPTLPAALKRAGYRTAHFGKWHLGTGTGAPLPSAYGFDVFRTVNGVGPSWPQQHPFFRAQSTSLIVDETLRFIEAAPDRPFYIDAWTLVPHAPLNPTEAQMEPYRSLAPDPVVPHRSAAQIYYASVTDLDRQVGRLLDRLGALGLAERTLVLFSSDNGPEEIAVRNAGHSGVGSAGPLRGRKRSLYEGGIRVPLIARWPGRVLAGRVDREAVLGGVDFFPTLAALTGAEVPAGHQPDGEDAGRALLGQPFRRRRPLLWEWRFGIAGHVWNRSPILAMREGKWKLLANPDGSRMELYDIPADPMESNNRARFHSRTAQRLFRAALAWQRTLPPGPMDPGAGRNDYPWPGSEPGGAR